MPEFIAYLAEQADTAPGTHTFSMDRGSDTARLMTVVAGMRLLQNIPHRMALRETKQPWEIPT